MKKISLLLMSAIIAVVFSACSDSDKDGINTSTESGFYVVNNGNQSSKISASLTKYDYSTDESTSADQDAFYNTNKIALGSGAQQALVYGGKMYIVMYESNIIWVVNPTTLEIITSIKTDGEANTPRYMVEKNGKLYCTMYTGYVCEIDPATNKITKTIPTGPNPEQIGVLGNSLIVACSDGMNYNGAASGGVVCGNSYIAKIDLDTYEETKITGLDKVLTAAQCASLNPTDVASNGTEAFVVCKGDYDNPETPNTVVKITESGVAKVCEGTMISISGNDLYVIYAQYGTSTTFTYRSFNTKTLVENGEFINQKSSPEANIEYPNGVFSDPVNGNIVILSYTLGSEGYAQYSEPCYANIYDIDGNFKKRIKCGVGSLNVAFFHERASKQTARHLLL